MKPRFLLKNRLILIFDLILLVVAAFGSFALRLDLGPLFIFYLPQAYWLVGLSLVIKPVVFYFFGLYRRLWVYASIRELLLILAAVTTASIIVVLAIVILLTYDVLPNYARGPLVIDWLLTLALIGGLRFALRILAESRVGVNEPVQHPKRVLIVGAGDAGELMLREIQKNPQLHLSPVGFLDDDPAKHRKQIHSVPVLGTIDDLGKVVTAKRVEEVIVAIPSAPGRVLRQVTEICRQRGIPSRTMPGLYELLGGKVNVNRLREVEITDLLRREQAHIDDSRLGESLARRKVLVTGAGGSIGRELCRQIARWSPSDLILFGHGENSIFETLLELQENFPSLAIHPVIGDVRDTDRLNNVFESFNPHVVFHAAAHKHVPMMEINVEEAITNNVLGTRNLVDAALNSTVERLVMISSDKAIRPTSVMGATKRLAEAQVISAAKRSGRAFSVVRFGNVLGSRGSVIPLFKRQIARGGPVTVTHPDMERYFMTIPEAVHLVLQAFTMGSGGEVFVLDMGEQVRVLDLAEDLIRLSGLEPHKDIDIVFTGIRPGEKLSEELWDSWAIYKPTAHPEIVLLDEEDAVTGPELESRVEELVHLAREGDAASILQILGDYIPGAAVRCQPPPEITSVV